MKIIQAMAISFTLIFAGCASVPTTEPQTAYQYDKSHSKAWNIATAAGLKNIKDYVVTDHTDRNALALGGAYAAASHFAGVGFSPADIGFGLLGSIATSGNMPANAKRWMMIWLPDRLAGTAEEAQEYIAKILMSATEKTIPVFTKGEIVEKTFAASYITFCVSPCKIEKELVSPLFGKPFFSNGDHYDPLALSVETPHKKPAPILSGEGSNIWAFDLSAQINAGNQLFLPKNEDNPLHGKDDAFSIAMSANLPDYFYFYLPATTTHGPMIINQGKKLYFIEP